MLCHCVVGSRVLVRCCVLVGFVDPVLLIYICGPCLRAGRGIVSRLVVSVVGSSRRGRNADRNLPLAFLLTLSDYDR
jgi:hypothetical protein